MFYYVRVFAIYQQMSSTTVYAIASGKGGVGKTTTTVNLGTALAGAGHRVAVVDTDLGMANLAGFVNLSADGPTLHDVLAGEATLSEATYEVAERIGAIPSGTELSGFAEADATGLRDVVDRLREEFDYVLLDVGAGISHESVLPLGIADETILVSTPEPASVQDVQKTIDLSERSGGDVAGLVLTRTRAGDRVSYDEIAARLDIPLLGTIPEDDAVRDSVYARTPLVVNTPDSPASTAYRDLAADLVGEAVDHEATTAAAESAEDSAADDVTDGDQPASSTDVSDALSDVDDAGDHTETDDVDDLPGEDIDLSLDEEDDEAASEPTADESDDGAVVEAETDAVEAATEGVDDSPESFDRGASSDDEGVTIPDAEDDGDDTDSPSELDDDAIPFRGGDSGAEEAAPDDAADDDEDGTDGAIEEIDDNEAAEENEAVDEETDDADADDEDDEKEGKGFLGGLF